MRADEGALLVCAALEPHRIVVAAEHVRQIGERADAEGARAGGAEGAGPDAALLFGARLEDRRRALWLSAGARSAWMIVGERVSVRRVPRAAFMALPSWVAIIGERLPVAGLVALDETFAFELDVARLLASASP